MRQSSPHLLIQHSRAPAHTFCFLPIGYSLPPSSCLLMEPWWVQVSGQLLLALRAAGERAVSFKQVGISPFSLPLLVCLHRCSFLDNEIGFMHLRDKPLLFFLFPPRSVLTLLWNNILKDEKQWLKRTTQEKWKNSGFEITLLSYWSGPR